ncbi:hypothetical protein Rhe02_26540 [Rhizocola hellebori]|uniref:Cobalamin-independent methionine synthase MetE C-terminal/archaeal domain-containing protein n=1 Tax=Rhizocola hellebori TaxID=1392758 RepID=A0A8J3VFZ2_9ACTN|nr:methionine synthase [Rhizocola hellebori]GIH04587.1 hypothetical protein Rhe02_26540 [Rhizocola hellebori]
MKATGVGSLPGTDIDEALSFTFGELPDFPYLPELPGRGPGADMIGRGSAFLVDLPVELYVGRWRVAAHAGADERQALDFLERDLDALTERADGYRGPLKVQAVGPWTLAASVELALGELLLKDHGAVRDLASSLLEGLRAHVAEIKRRVPGAEVILQLDEPSLPAAMAGEVRTASGLYTYRSVEASRARDVLKSFVDGVGSPVVVHCCARNAPLGLFREAGVAGVAIDLSLVKDLDPIGEAIDAGLVLYAGVAPTAAASVPSSSHLADRLRRVWSDLGFAPELMAKQAVLTPACGLATSTPAYARGVLKACREAAQRLSE